MKSLKLLTEYTSRKVYSLWGRVGKMPIRKKQNSLLFDKWYFDPPTHGISTPYPWYFDPPIHGILTSLPISWLEMGGGVKIPWGFNLPYRGGGQFSIRGFNIPWMKIDGSAGYKLIRCTCSTGNYLLSLNYSCHVIH